MTNFIKIFIFYIILISSIAIILCKESKEEFKKKPQSIDAITQIYNWAKKNNIYISEKLTMHKPNKQNPSHNNYYFTSNSIIPNNTLLFKINLDTIISRQSLEKIIKNSKIKKFANLWERINNLNNGFMSYNDTKQLCYITILIENAVNKRKGDIYKIYGDYLDLYEFINMDHFPIYYEAKEINYLINTNLIMEMQRAKEALEQEFNIVENDLEIKGSMEETYLKYRILALSLSITYSNSFINKNDQSTETVLVPFIDFFDKSVNVSYSNSEYNIIKEGDSNYFVIYATKEIQPNSEIKLKWESLANQECLIYYGFIDEKNFLVPEYNIDVFNKLFRRHLEVDEKLGPKIDKIITKPIYEVSREIFDNEIIGIYNKLYKLFDRYKDKEEGAYLMMIDNLNYYLELYKYDFEDFIINNKIESEEKQRHVKNILKIEELLIKNGINRINEKIFGIKKDDKKEKSNEDL